MIILLGNTIEKNFNAGAAIKTKIGLWAFSGEDHWNGNKKHHVSLKLSHPKKWRSVKSSIQSYKNILIHFSDYHSIADFKHVSKSNNKTFLTTNHPKTRTIKKFSCVRAFSVK